MARITYTERVVGQPLSIARVIACYMVTAHGPTAADDGADTASWHLINSFEEGMTTFGSGDATPSTVMMKFTFSAATIADEIAATQTVTDGTRTWLVDSSWVSAAGGETEAYVQCTCLTTGLATNVKANKIDEWTVDVNTDVTITAVTNEAPGIDGSWPDAPDLDYTAEHVIFLHFDNYNVGPVAMKNVYDKTVHTGGVGDVTSEDFVSPLNTTANDIIKETKRIFQWLAVPGFATKAWNNTATGGTDQNDIDLLNAMINQQDHMELFNVNLVLDYDPTQTTLATALGHMGAGSYYRRKNLNIGWPKLNGYFASIHKIARFMVDMNDANVGNGVPYQSAGNKDTFQRFNSLDTNQLNYVQANQLNDVGCFTFLQDFTTTTVRLWGGFTSYYLSTVSSPPSDAIVYNFDGSTNALNWNRNQLSLNLFRRLSSPYNQSNIDAIIATINNQGELLRFQGAMLGYRVEYDPTKNTALDFAAGKITVTVYFLPAGQVEEITIDAVIDRNIFASVFTQAA